MCRTSRRSAAEVQWGTLLWPASCCTVVAHSPDVSPAKGQAVETLRSLHQVEERLRSMTDVGSRVGRQQRVRRMRRHVGSMEAADTRQDLTPSASLLQAQPH